MSSSSPVSVFQPSSFGSTPTGTPGGGSGTSLANSASLYLYTFLATLVLLLSVSGAIVVRSFILRRRHRRMVEEAMRNGTWVPPTFSRPARVDLSKRPEVWDAYLGGGGWQGGGLDHGGGKALGLSTSWKSEYSKDWESMNLISAEPYAFPTPNLTTLSSPVPDPVPAPTTLLTPRRDEESQETAEVSTTPSLLTRARIFLHPPRPLSPPTSFTAADNGTNPHSANISMTELNSSSPATVRVTVLIAMPSLSPHGSCTAPSCSAPSCSAPSCSLSSSCSSKPQATTSHPLESSSSSCPISKTTNLPHLEMGVAEVVISPAETPSTWDTERREGKTSFSRGSSYAE